MLLDLRIEPDLSLASTLPARLYLDPAVLDFERERIFYRSWQWVGHTSRLTQDGDYATTAVLEQPLVLLRDGAELRGFYNVCRHRGGAVAVGEGNRRTLQCHYHGWTYGLDGSLRGTPDFAAARCFDRAASGLLPVPVAQAAGLLFTNLAGRGGPGPAGPPGVCRQPPGPSLSELLGELNVSHTGSGYRPRTPGGDATAALGVFFDESHTGPGLKVAEVIENGPLSLARSGVKAGSVIEKIDGVAILPGMEFDSLLNQKAGRRVQLGVFDPATQRQLDRGYRMVELLKQGQYQPLNVVDQIMVIFAGNAGGLDAVGGRMG